MHYSKFECGFLFETDQVLLFTRRTNYISFTTLRDKIFSKLTIMLYYRGFENYMVSSGELAYQQLCNEITMEFKDCSKQVMTTSYLTLLHQSC